MLGLWSLPGLFKSKPFSLLPDGLWEPSLKPSIRCSRSSLFGETVRGLWLAGGASKKSKRSAHSACMLLSKRLISKELQAAKKTAELGATNSLGGLPNLVQGPGSSLQSESVPRSPPQHPLQNAKKIAQRSNYRSCRRLPLAGCSRCTSVILLTLQNPTWHAGRAVLECSPPKMASGTTSRPARMFGSAKWRTAASWRATHSVSQWAWYATTVGRRASSSCITAVPEAAMATSQACIVERSVKWCSSFEEGGPRPDVDHGAK